VENEKTDVAFNAQVKCDMTPFGLGKADFDATVVFGPNDDPESIEVNLPVASEKKKDLYSQAALDIDHYFASPDFEGRLLESNTAFKGRIVRISGMQPLGLFEKIRLSCAIDGFEFLGRHEAAEPSVVVFRLTNVPYCLRGDTVVVRPVSDRPPSPLETDFFQTTELQALNERETRERFKSGWQFSASRIDFAFGGRNWSLDTTQGYENGKNGAAALRPMVTATLTTSADPAVDAKVPVDRICDLLTFALGKEVRWVSCGWFSQKGLSKSACRSFPLLPYGKGAGALIDNWESGNLRGFLEQSEIVFRTAPDWWHRSIGLLAHARATSLLEIRLSTLNTLVDRISRKVIDNLETFEIDANLPNRLNRHWFRWCLHILLRTLSPKWDMDRTNAVCKTIKDWNAAPSFPNQIVRACETLGIGVPARGQLKFRHKLIHVGEFDRSLKTQKQIVEYLESLEAVVELMMIRLLGFTGFVHVDKHGPNRQEVGALLHAEEPT
jgi:hypothetical protein